MKPEEFSKWLESWVKGRSSEPKVELSGPKVVPDVPYNLYDDKEWLTISWGLIR